MDFSRRKYVAKEIKTQFYMFAIFKEGFCSRAQTPHAVSAPCYIVNRFLFLSYTSGENSFTNGKVFFTSNYWNVSKQYFFTILFPRQLTRNRNVRNSLLLWKTNGTYCTYLIEGQVNIKSLHCKSNCNQYHHIYTGKIHYCLFQRLHLN